MGPRPSSTLAVAVLVATQLAGLCVGFIGRDQPRLRVDNGHLYIEGSRNISIKAMQSVNIQGRDLSAVIRMLERVAPKLEAMAPAQPLAGLAGALSEAQLRSISGRLMVLEDAVRNVSVASGAATAARPAPGQLVSINRRLRTVERKVRTMERLLNTNDCLSSPCANGATCEDVYNGFICRCTSGWEGPTCEADVDECVRLAGTTLGCQAGGTCLNTPGGFRCICPPGHFGLHCTLSAAACGAGADLCGGNGVCVPAANNGYDCVCNPGWQRDPDTKACTRDIDECAAPRPACSHDPAVACINVPGSFHCGSCPRGYVGNGYYCADVDECLTNNGGCSTSPSVQCINTRGSSVCGPCPAGYVGDGRTCTFRGVCEVDNGGCHPMALCLNLPGSGQAVTCQCRPGYAGPGVGPQGCVAVASAAQATGPCASGPCRNGATCTSSTASDYSCFCAPGFKGRNCETADPCGAQPCLNGATCTPQGASFSCDCPDGFTGARCESKNEACGGFLRSEAGALRFPHNNHSLDYPHGANCGWVIVTNDTRVLNVTFRTFDLEDVAGCTYDWLQIHDGPTSGAYQLGRFCGSKLPNGGNIVSTHNTLYLWFRSDSSITRQGFELHWTSVPPVCGGQVEFESHASISSPGSPGKYPADRDCWWTLKAPPGRRVQLHFFSMQIEDSRNCTKDFLEVVDGGDADGPRLARYCNSSDHPAPLVASGRELLLHFKSDHDGQDAGFQIAASAADGTPGCGGVFTEPSGTVFPPKGADGNYQPNLDCGWKIQVPLAERVAFEFTGVFELEGTSDCHFDYLSVYDGPDRNAPLLGTYCDDTAPPRAVSSGNTLYVVFHSDASYNLQGFTLAYEVYCGGVFTALQGELLSPYYPNAYPQSRRCVYEIRMPAKTAVTLQFLDFDVEHNSAEGECFYDYVKVIDGDNANATAIGTYCGAKGNLPDRPLVSTHNYMYIEFVTDGTIGERGFRANYSAIELICGGILKERHGVIESPREGGGYPPDATCSWLLAAPPGFVVQLSVVSLNLEKCRDCSCDYLAVHDNSTTPGAGGPLGRFCGRTPPPVMTSTDSVMNVVFHSDKTVSSEGFMATYTFLDTSQVCGAKYMSASGVLRSPGFPNQYANSKDCVYTVRVRDGRQLRVNFTDFDLEESRSCNWDYVEIRNGGSERSPLVGKYCGTALPPSFITATNEVFVRFRSDASRGGRGFELRWDSASTGCGGALNASTGTVHSPNYPDAYANHAECYWSIAVARGSAVKAIFTDLDMEATSRCLFDFVELLDGVPGVGKSLGKYCSGRPDPVVTRTNHLYVRFHSDAMLSGRGFVLEYESMCNNNLTGMRGVIESPNWPHAAPMRADCAWSITVPAGNTVNITFSHMSVTLPYSLPGRGFRRPYGSRGWIYSPPHRLPETRQQEADEITTCHNVYVKIQDSERREDDDVQVPGPELGRFCGTRVPPTVSSKTNKVFVTFSSPVYVAGTGFRLEWASNGCGGELRRPEGAFTSPNYPRAYKEDHVCEWTIVADWGRLVELTIWDMNMEQAQNCYFDNLAVYGGPDDQAPELTKLCSTAANPIVVTSASRHMFVRFRSDSSFSGRGFNASYKTLPGRCGGRLTAPYGVLHSPNYPNNYGAKDDCVWRIEVADKHAVQFSLKDLDIDFSVNPFPVPNRNCTTDYLEVVDGRELDGPVLLRVCGSRLPANSTVVASGNALTVRFKSDGTRFAKGFKAEYKTVCGATIVTASSGIIASHDAVNTFGDNPNCSWTVIAADPADHVTLTITQLAVNSFVELESEDQCPLNNHVAVWEGVDDTGPLLGRYCSGRVPPGIVSRGPALHVRAVSPYNNFHGWFSAAYSVIASACGGTIVAESGSIASPGYPDSYAPNTECEWNITMSPGNKVQLGFSLFNIEESPGCVEDFLEVRRDGAMGPLLGAFCGDVPPANLSAEHSLWIKFRSNGQGSAPGFVAAFALVHGNLDLTGPRGQIASPLYPAGYIKTGNFHWRVTVAPNKVISLAFKELSTDRLTEDCDMVYLQIHDGFDDTSPSAFKGCGVERPAAVTTTSNAAYVTLHNDPIRLPTKFLLEWAEVDRSSRPSVTASDAACSAKIHLPAGHTINVTSPGYPRGYGVGLNCTWEVDTVPGWHLLIYFQEMDLEPQGPECYMDRVLVHTGVAGPNWRLAYTLCLPNATFNASLTTSNYMLVNFVSDWGINGTGFSAIIASVCGGELTGPSGVIRSPNMTANLPGLWSPPASSCEWTVTARRGRTLAAVITDISIRPEAGDGGGPGTCGNSFVLLKNGGSAASPLLGDGKYCGYRPVPSVPETTSNQLYVKFDRHEHDARFVLRYEERSDACGGEVRLSADAPSQIISSPNFPNIAPPFAECVWLVMAPPGHRVRLDFVGRFDVSSTGSDTCRESAVEVRDGGTESAEVLGTFCRSKPGSVDSLDNVMRVRYYNEDEVPSNGFSANVSIATCGGTLRGDEGAIASPGYPNQYPAMTRCEWVLEVRPSATMTIAFTDLNLNGQRGSCQDSVTILSEAGDNNATAVELAKFCRSQKTDNVTSLTNKVRVVFQSNSSGTTNFKGFALRFSANKNDCGGTLAAASGTIQSAGYPSRVLRHRCTWSIRAPEGRRITLNFKDLDLSSALYHSYSMQRVLIYHGEDGTILAKSINYTVPSGFVFESTSSTLQVALFSMLASNNRGFRLKYTTDEPILCGGSLSGPMAAPLGPPDGNRTSYMCSWRLRAAPEPTADDAGATASWIAPRGGIPQSASAPNRTTLAVRVLRLEGAGKYRSPCTRYTSVVVLRQSDTEVLGRLCYTIKDPVTFLSPYYSNTLVVSRPWYLSSMDFSVAYSWSACGGVLDSPAEITSPGFYGPAASYPNDTRCAWKINFEEGEQALVTFETVDLLAGSCDDFVEVHNGDSSLAPKLGPFCRPHEPLHASGRSLWIEFHSGSNPERRGRGFRITFSTTARACGGIHHGTGGELSSPGFPRAYPENVECVWEVRVQPGYRVALSFVERFNIPDRYNCTGDYLSLWDWDDQGREWVEGGGAGAADGLPRRVCGRSAPGGRLLSSGSRLRLVFRSDGSGSAEGFKVRWAVACGVARTLGAGPTSRGEVVSPGFPVAYPAGLNCTYDLRAPGYTIVARFDAFSVEPGKGCRFDNVTVVEDPDTQFSAFAAKRAVYCDARLPPAEIRVKDRLVFTFQTDKWLQQQGFRLVYQLDQCEQHVTEPSEISPPMDGDNYQALANCTWNVTAPEGKVVRLRLSAFQVETSYECFSDSLAVFDGAAANESTLLGRFCGNMTHNLPVLRSSGRGMVLRWQTDSTVQARGFAARVFFERNDCGTLAARNRVFNITTATHTIPLEAGPASRAVVVTQGPPPPFQDCDYSFTAPEGHVVRLTAVDVAGLGACPNYTHHARACDCSFLQVADGPSQYSEAVGKFCAARPAPTISSSDRSLWVRFSTGDFGASRALSFTVTAVPSVCGKTSFRLDANTTEIVIQSPNYPAPPPAFAHCVYVVEASENGATLNVTDLDLNGLGRCAAGAAAEGYIRTGRLDFTRTGMGSMSSSLKVNVGRQLISSEAQLSLGAEDIDQQTTSYCARERPPPITLMPYANGVRIVFHSGEPGPGRGFQIRVHAGRNCPPETLTEPSGRLVFSTGTPVNCRVLIAAAPNQTVTLFIMEHSYLSDSENCKDAVLQVVDGGRADSPLLSRMCGTEMGRGLSSSGRDMLLTFQSNDNGWGRVEAFYYTTDQGRGCGGRIHQSQGFLSSPLYPAPYRNNASTVCRWDIEVPGAQSPALLFKTFDLGPHTSCETDFLEVFDVDEEGRETRRARFCGQETPAVVRGSTHRMAIKYTTSMLNGGTGWFAGFTGVGSGDRL